MFSAQEDKQTSIRSLSDATASRIWLVCMIIGLVMAWCVLDSWNHDMSSQLYQMSAGQGLSVDPSGAVSSGPQIFKYTLTLCFIQFVFCGVVSVFIFMAKTICLSKEPLAAVGQNLEQLGRSLSNAQWPALVTTHISGSFLLQSLMMPAKMMSLSLFAATRAVEVPVAAVMRKHILGINSGGPSSRTTVLMFAAAWLLFFSYTQIAECLCVWSGFGVALSGLPLFIVYAFLLTLPATNAVLQESVMVRLQVSPFLMQGIQNLGAAALFVPILIAAQWLGYEDVQHAIAIITRNQQVYMTVLWLCVQTLTISFVTVGMILTMDSFWAVAARSLRVVFWWSRNLQLFYLGSSTLLSVSRPHASIWSFVMLCGTVLGFTAFVTDRRQIEDVPEDKSLMSSSERLSKYI